jgi:hypothetical protein
MEYLVFISGLDPNDAFTAPTKSQLIRTSERKRE